ncbi:mannose-1-phosphate guanylyltransferase/mannose-6-phosphate isomerase [Ramlibacter sp. AW1]|uniref:mannose-1-phosphate guanylyltransferase n=1 Tax=Ramlibacter aurantiacus TaxID=2801330 RepID=A0A937D6E9_9BURK|nr:mannose-1-phosphate guanylyltransferase/mannose-6-phosphate isomerase [Ramlibacter aurantiacus]MBL0422257.1 mannose-1-phosphate guanylyltransferase/mannose-6-phosphate isomerase [Ramlibacter aurantiacus]
MKIVAVVLSGGAGTRLWPASRQAHPKPFMRLGESSLLLQAVQRGHACGSDDVVIVTNQEHVHLTRTELKQASPSIRVHYVLEPVGRNTAPAIALAAMHCDKTYGPDTVMVVLPADHLIPDNEAFVANALEAAALAREKNLVVFGIGPTSPETAFGYIEVEHVSRKSQPILKFVEKPDLATAQSYLATGRFYWNSGMFCFTARSILDALSQHSPETASSARRVFDHASSNGDATHFDNALFGTMPDISIDYAVMERARNTWVVPARFGWSDVGSWPAVADAHPADSVGNTFATDVVALDTTGSHVQVESHGTKVVAMVGVKDLVVVDTPDALLVAHKASAQNVKRVVDILKSRGHASTHLPASVHRPWGTYATLKEEEGYKVKRITVSPGGSLSLQYHHHRSEHWVVVQGSARVQIGEREFLTEPGQSRYIPKGEKHRLTNVGSDELVLIEVQCGSYLGEDDIVRLADCYGRV